MNQWSPAFDQVLLGRQTYSPGEVAARVGHVCRVLAGMRSAAPFGFVSRQCGLCGATLKGDSLGHYSITNKQLRHAKRHLLDFGIERLTVLMSMLTLASAHGAAEAITGCHPGSSGARTFWRNLREQTRRGG